MTANPPITIRNDVRPGDIEALIAMHVDLFGREYGLDKTFADHIRGPMNEFVERRSPRERLWIAERENVIVGCVGLVTAKNEPEGTAQLRWFLVDPCARGFGLGTRLLNDCITFARRCGYSRMILWTLSSLTPAIRLYHAAGFCRTEEKPGKHWGVDVVEEKYERMLLEDDSSPS